MLRILRTRDPNSAATKGGVYSLTNVGIKRGASLVKELAAGAQVMIEPARVFASFPASLRGELLGSYGQIVSNYIERRWEPSELNGGKFCEVVYSIINGAISGTFPAYASKPADMVAACRALEKNPPSASRVGDRSLRILIPRTLLALYEIRNNRGVGHVGGDVNANHMDAEAVLGMASWTMAELVRIFHGVSTAEAQEIADALVERRSAAVWEFEGVRRVLNPSLSTKDQVLLLLYHSTAWVPTADLFRWVEYSNSSVFRSHVLQPLHKARLIEHDTVRGRARISPSGIFRVEQNILGTARKSAA